MSHGLPIVTINSTAMGKIVRQEQIGYAVGRNEEEFDTAILKLTHDQQTYQHYVDNVRDALLNRHLWKHRVEQIVRELTE